MKIFKVMALAAVAFLSATVANAQEFGESHSRVYAGYNNFGAFDSDAIMHGFIVGYEYDMNGTGRNVNPMFVTVGLEYMLATEEHGKFHALSLPINFKYTFGNEKFAVTPYVGQSVRVGLINEYDVVDSRGNIVSENFYDLDGTNRFQILFNGGIDFEFGKFAVGYRFQAAEIKMGNASSDYCNSIILGYKF